MRRVRWAQPRLVDLCLGSLLLLGSFSRFSIGFSLCFASRGGGAFLLQTRFILAFERNQARVFSSLHRAASCSRDGFAAGSRT